MLAHGVLLLGNLQGRGDLSAMISDIDATSTGSQRDLNHPTGGKSARKGCVMSGDVCRYLKVCRDNIVMSCDLHYQMTVQSTTVRAPASSSGSPRNFAKKACGSAATNSAFRFNLQW